MKQEKYRKQRQLLVKTVFALAGALGGRGKQFVELFKTHWRVRGWQTAAMAAQGAALQSHNNELVKCKEDFVQHETLVNCVTDISTDLPQQVVVPRCK